MQLSVQNHGIVPAILLFTLLSCIFPCRADQNVLFLGDSWAAFADPILFEKNCPGSQVQVVAEASTTASTWSETLDSRLDAASLENNYVPDYVWVSIGGNDFLDQFPTFLPTGGSDQVVSDIRTVIQGLMSRYPNVQVVLTAYALPSVPLVSKEVFDEILSVYLANNYGDSVSTILVYDLFGGTVNDNSITASNATLFQDPIHLNDNGYTTFFQHTPFLNAMGCSTSPPSTSPGLSSGAPFFQCKTKYCLVPLALIACFLLV